MNTHADKQNCAMFRTVHTSGRLHTRRTNINIHAIFDNKIGLKWSDNARNMNRPERETDKLNSIAIFFPHSKPEIMIERYNGPP